MDACDVGANDPPSSPSKKMTPKIDRTRVTFGNLSRPDGSALILQNQTIVQTASYGPVDIAQSKINYEESVIEVLYKRKISISMSNPLQAELREYENFIKTTFQYVLLTRLHPRTLISIIVQEIYDGGSIVTTAITGTCCALIDCGLPMRCIAAGVTVVTILNKDTTLDKNSHDDEGDNNTSKFLFIVQPNKEQESQCCSRFDLVFEHHSYKLIAIKTQGIYNQCDLKEATRLARLESEKIFDQIRDDIKARFLKRVK